MKNLNSHPNNKIILGDGSNFVLRQKHIAVLCYVNKMLEEFHLLSSSKEKKSLS